MLHLLPLLLNHLFFISLLLTPQFWTSFSRYHHDATKAISHRWQQLQLTLQTPTTLIVEDESEDEYEEWVDNEIKRFQCVLREIEVLEGELERARKVGVVAKKMGKWVEDVWVREDGGGRRG
jgi:hypothetical protein